MDQDLALRNATANAQDAKLAALNQDIGRKQMGLRVLAWANDPVNKLKLQTVGLVDSLLEVINAEKPA